MGIYSKNANWIAFVMHFILGAILGCFGGLMVIMRKRHGIWLNEDLVLPFLIGAALIGAGLGARLGDKLWIGLNYKVIPPDAPEHSEFSYFTAHFVTFVGVLLVVVSLFRHFHISYA